MLFFVYESIAVYNQYTENNCSENKSSNILRCSFIAFTKYKSYEHKGYSPAYSSNEVISQKF